MTPTLQDTPTTHPERDRVEQEHHNEADDPETILIPIKQNNRASTLSPTTQPYTAATMLQEVLKKIYALSLAEATTLLTAQVLRQFREDLMGLDRIRQIILKRHTPEEVKYQLASEEDLANLLKLDVVEEIKNCALGYATAQTVVQWRAASTSTDSDQGLSRLQSTLDSMIKQKKITPPFLPTKEPIDYLPLHAFVQDQKDNGCLVDDDAWETHGAKAHHKWDHRLKKSLEHMNKIFNLAAESVDFPALVAAPLLLVQSAPPAALTIIIEETLAAHSTLDLMPMVSLPPPTVERPKQSDDLTEEEGDIRGRNECDTVKDDLQELGALGQRIYGRLSTKLEKVAEHAEVIEDWPTLEAAAHGLLNTGSITPRNALRWGKALTQMKRYAEAERAFTLALTILTTGSGTGIVHSRSGSTVDSSTQRNKSSSKQVKEGSSLSSSPTADSLRERHQLLLRTARSEVDTCADSPPKAKYNWRNPPAKKAPASRSGPWLGASSPADRQSLGLVKQKAAREALLGRGLVRRFLVEEMQACTSAAASAPSSSPKCQCSPAVDGGGAAKAEEREEGQEAKKNRALLISLAKADLQAVVDFAEQRSSSGGATGGEGRGVASSSFAGSPSRSNKKRSSVPGAASSPAKSTANVDTGTGETAVGGGVEIKDLETIQAVEGLLALASL